jgi:hypothetical protein
MANKLARVAHNSLFQIVVGSALLAGSVLLGLTLYLSHSNTAQNRLSTLGSHLGVSHPLGRLRGTAPLPQSPASAAPAPSASLGQLDQMHVLVHERGASGNGAGRVGSSID